MHRRTLGARFALFDAYAQSFDLRAASRELQQVIDVDEQIGSQDELGWAYPIQASYAVALGHHGLAKRSLDRWFVVSKQQPDAGAWLGLRAWAVHRGWLEILPYLDEHAPPPRNDTERMVLADLRAVAAFNMGDRATARAAAEQAAAIAGRLGKKFNAIIVLPSLDALDGNEQAANKRLALLANEPEVIRLTAEAYLRIAQRRWRDAVAVLSRTRELERTDGWYDINLAETTAWLGIAPLGAGDADAAIGTLEAALDQFDSTSPNYLTPFAQLALARALWDTGRDKPRARRLADAAVHGFERLGKYREPDRQAAIDWLATHAL